jgi:hypothetical protein
MRRAIACGSARTARRRRCWAYSRRGPAPGVITPAPAAALQAAFISTDQAGRTRFSRNTARCKGRCCCWRRSRKSRDCDRTSGQGIGLWPGDRTRPFNTRACGDARVSGPRNVIGRSALVFEDDQAPFLTVPVRAGDAGNLGRHGAIFAREHHRGRCFWRGLAFRVTGPTSLERRRSIRA